MYKYADARKRGKSTAFSLISSGTFGYPIDEALAVAVNAINEWLIDNEMEVLLVLFDKTTFSLSQELLKEIRFLSTV